MRSPFSVFAVFFVVLWASARVGLRFREHIESIRAEFGVVLTAILSLLGLIIGFTFSMAVNRYDQRKLFEEKEADTIGTVYVRTRLLPAPQRDEIRNLLRRYVDRRIQIYQKPTAEEVEHADPLTSQLQTDLRRRVQDAAEPQPTPLMALLVSGTDDMLSAQGYAQATWRNRIPDSAWLLMGAIAICSQIMIGLYFRTVNPTGALPFVLPIVLSISFFLIADLETQSGGLIHVVPSDLIDVAASMQQ
jgi:hypothetical protein